MNFVVRCSCGAGLSVPEGAAGNEELCRSCGRAVTIPTLSELRAQAGLPPTLLAAR